MEKTFEMMRKIKAVLPAEKANRVFCDDDGHTNKKIVICNHLDAIARPKSQIGDKAPLNSQLSKKEIAEIEALDFVDRVCESKFSNEEFYVYVKAN